MEEDMFQEGPIRDNTNRDLARRLQVELSMEQLDTEIAFHRSRREWINGRAYVAGISTISATVGAIFDAFAWNGAFSQGDRALSLTTLILAIVLANSIFYAGTSTLDLIQQSKAHLRAMEDLTYLRGRWADMLPPRPPG